MSDFVAFSEEIEEGMEFLEHYGILKQRWGVKNGPPYPLGAGDHSKAEKAAAKAAGVKVGKSSGKGSIENVKSGSKPEVHIMKGGSQTGSKSAKKEMTDEEKRQAALEAVKTADKKKIAKYVDQLTTDELRDAQNRAQMKDQLTKKDPSEEKNSKAEMEKREAMLSGDKEKVKQYADKMTSQELVEAMNKVNLMEQLNHVDPPPSAMDKLSNFMNNVERFRQNAEKGIAAYNTAAKVYNSTHKDSQWPIIGDKPQAKEKSQEERVAEALARQMANDVRQTHAQNQKQQQQKSYEEQSREALENAKTDYKNRQKFEKWKEKQEAKEAKKNNKQEETVEEQPRSNPAPQQTPKAPPVPQNVSNKKISDYDDVPSYDELIPDDVRDVMNRKVS